MAVAGVLSVVTGTACRRPAAASAPVPPPARAVRSEVVAGPVRLGLGDIRPDTLDRVAAHTAALHATPAAVRLAVGDTLWLDTSVRVAVLDSAGRDLGRLPVYDAAMMPGAAVMVRGAGLGGGIAALRPGEGVLRIGFPRSQWAGRSDPPPYLDLPIAVGPRR